MIEATDSLLDRLIGLQVGGCTCMTKTPDVRYHEQACTYRVAHEAFHEIVRLSELTAQQPSEPAAQQWEPLSTWQESDDLIWLCRGDAVEGPRVGSQFDIDYWDWWCRVEPPSLPTTKEAKCEPPCPVHICAEMTKAGMCLAPNGVAKP